MHLLLCTALASSVESVHGAFAPKDAAVTITDVPDLLAGMALLDAGTLLDLIVIDLALPDARNRALVRQFLEKTGPIPVVVLSDAPTWQETSTMLGTHTYLVNANLEGAALAETLQEIVESGTPESPEEP
jgi:DNA-binding NarL/FixJ family response regulator